MPVIAALMLPSTVLTHLKAGLRDAVRPEPVTIGWWAQPTLVTAVKQSSPSLTTVLAGSSDCWAKASTSARRKPLTRRSLTRTGLALGVVSTAAINGVLPGAPRPRLPPERSPPR